MSAKDWDAGRRFTDPMVGLRYRADGTVVSDGQSPEIIARLERIIKAWRTYNETGDRSELVELGILPDRRDC